MTEKTIENLILDNRGRRYITTSCGEFKWKIPEDPDSIKGIATSGTIYDMTMKLPQDLRQMNFRQNNFDTSKSINKFENYLGEKTKEVVSIIKPEVKENISTYGDILVQRGVQENPELESKRRELAFAYAVSAFLRHI